MPWQWRRPWWWRRRQRKIRQGQKIGQSGVIQNQSSQWLTSPSRSLLPLFPASVPAIFTFSLFLECITHTLALGLSLKLFSLLQTYFLQIFVGIISFFKSLFKCHFFSFLLIPARSCQPSLCPHTHSRSLALHFLLSLAHHTF